MKDMNCTFVQMKEEKRKSMLILPCSRDYLVHGGVSCLLYRRWTLVCTFGLCSLCMSISNLEIGIFCSS